MAAEKLESDIAVADGSGVVTDGADLAADAAGGGGQLDFEETQTLGGAPDSDAEVVHGIGAGVFRGPIHFQSQMVQQAPDGFHLP